MSGRGRRWTPASTVRALAAAIAVVTAACGGSAATISNGPSPGKQPAAEIPRSRNDAPATYTPASLPPRGNDMPPLTVPLMDPYHYRPADVLR